MKIFLCMVFCSVLTFAIKLQKTQKKAFPPKPNLRRFCNTSAECFEDECCIARGPLGGWKGRCKELGKEDQMCTSEEIPHLKKFMKHCPCQKGLSCEINEPKKELQSATIYDIYNVCLNKKEIKIVSRERKKEMEGNKTKTETS